MEGIILTVCIISFSFLLAYIALHIDMKEHGIMSLLLLLLALSSTLLLPKVALDNNDHCELVVTNFTNIDAGSGSLVIGNQTINTYDYVCVPNTNTTATTFLKLTYAVPSLVLLYILIYLFYKLWRRKE